MFNFTIKRFKSLIKNIKHNIDEETREYHDSRITKYAVVAYNETAELEAEISKLISENKELFFNVVDNKIKVFDIRTTEDGYLDCLSPNKGKLFLIIYIPKSKINATIIHPNEKRMIDFDDGKDILIKGVIPSKDAYKDGEDFYDDGYWCHKCSWCNGYHISHDLFFFPDPNVDIKTLKDAKLTKSQWEHVYLLAKNTKRRKKIVIETFKYYLKHYGIYF